MPVQVSGYESRQQKVDLRSALVVTSGEAPCRSGKAEKRNNDRRRIPRPDNYLEFANGDSKLPTRIRKEFADPPM